MSFRSVFIAIVIGFGLVLAGFLVDLYRPPADAGQPNATFVRATGMGPNVAPSSSTPSSTSTR